MTAASGLASVLTSRLQALWGTAVEVTGVRPLPGGASRESWDVQARTALDAQAGDAQAGEAEAGDTHSGDTEPAEERPSREPAPKSRDVASTARAAIDAMRRGVVAYTTLAD
jgi:hypothetical protein